MTSPEPRPTPVVVTGLGPITAIGHGRDAFWDALVAGRHGFGPITLFDPAPYASRIAAEIRDFRPGGRLPGVPGLARRMSRPVQMAMAAVALAVRDAGDPLDAYERQRIGVLVGTSIGSLESFAGVVEQLRHRGMLPGPRDVFYCFNHAAACLLSSVFDVQGPIQTITTGCNSALDAMGEAARLIRSGVVDAMLVVGTDSEIVPELIAGLCAAGSICTKFNDTPGLASRPFEKDRDGVVIGEGAGALVLEAEPAALRRGARIYARLAAQRVNAAGRGRRYEHRDPLLDVRPAVRALRGVMDEAGWTDTDVDLVSANGSSSVIYDRVEALALAEAFGESFPHIRVHSIKSQLGQHGAGSSALQAIAACLSIDRGIVPPTINYDTPDPACGPIRITTRVEEFRPRRVLVHSIGFGGFYYSAAGFEALPGPEQGAGTPK